jgi:hypothetical protein
MPKKEPILTPTDMVIVKVATCNKLSQRATGELSYHIGKVESDHSVHIQIKANSSGGYFSKEWVPLTAIESCLTLDMKSGTPFTTATLKESFISKSQNNAGFLGAVLVAEGIMVPVPDKAFGYSMESKNWKEWKNAMLQAKATETEKQHKEPQNIKKPK